MLTFDYIRIIKKNSFLPKVFSGANTRIIYDRRYLNIEK